MKRLTSLNISARSPNRAHPALLAVTLAALIAACSHGGAHESEHTDAPAGGVEPTPLALPPSDAPFEVGAAEDLDPDPAVVRVALEAREAEVELTSGVRVRLWTYNGQLPGPTIEARVGDEVVVELHNLLPEPTTVHWHGLRVPSEMDGVVGAAGAAGSDEPLAVPPGGRREYRFRLLDAGTFWYHPHVRTDEQVERGLYGAFVVRGPEDPAAPSTVVMLDDIRLREESLSGEGDALAPFSDEDAMLGRLGNVLLVNGHPAPTLRLSPGAPRRLRLINASNARYFRLAPPGGTLTQLSTDGGLLTAPVTRDELLLVPGERADVLWTPREGEEGVWRLLPYARGHGTGGEMARALFELQATEEAVSAPHAPTATLAPLAPLGAPTLSRILTLEESEGDASAHGAHGAHGASGAATFSINGAPYPTGEPLRGRLGSVEEWRVENTTEMDHPFHLHGFRFQVVGAELGAAPQDPAQRALAAPDPALLAWRDTVNVPARGALTLRVDLSGYPGRFMFHCHLLEHGERGMMGELWVEE